MTAKRAPRKRKESVDITEEFTKKYKQNFDCSDIKIKKPFPFTDNHTAFYYLTQDDRTNMVFLDGPAGSMKSYISVFSAMEMLRDRKVDKIIYIRTVVESASKSLGYLKGDENEKFAAYTLPLFEKISEITDKATVNSLFEQEYVKAMPVNFVRGLTFNNAVVIIDEAQNATRSELTTIMTRFGRGSKYIICGDAKQSDIKDSGFSKVFELFDTDFSRKNNIHCMKFDIHDISRSAILKHITQVLSV
jgi:phosphate starvation-inducible PhoH-like protein